MASTVAVLLTMAILRDAGVRFRNRPEPEPHRTAPQVRSGSGSGCKDLRKFRRGAVQGAAYAVHLVHPVRTGLHPEPYLIFTHIKRKNLFLICAESYSI